jgi:hypothetical protein
MKTSLERLRRCRQKWGNEMGVTLIGFQIVSIMVILGVPTSTGVLAAYNPSNLNPQTLCAADFKSVELAAEAYKAQTGVYPGGTLPAGSTATPGSPPRGIRPNPQILDLTGTVTVFGLQSGPWLRGYPYDPHHFQIGFASPTAVPASQTFVENVRGTATIPAVSTYDVADCSSVKHKPQHSR